MIVKATPFKTIEEATKFASSLGFMTYGAEWSGWEGRFKGGTAMPRLIKIDRDKDSIIIWYYSE